MKTHFITGDIVEILNLSKSQIDDIRSQTCDLSKDANRDIVGMRYRVKRTWQSHKNEMFVDIVGWGHGGYNAHLFREHQLRLIKRPLKNWIKHIYANIFGVKR